MFEKKYRLFIDGFSFKSRLLGFLDNEKYTGKIDGNKFCFYSNRKYTITPVLSGDFSIINNETNQINTYIDFKLNYIRVAIILFIIIFLKISIPSEDTSKYLLIYMTAVTILTIITDILPFRRNAIKLNREFENLFKDVLITESST